MIVILYEQSAHTLRIQITMHTFHYVDIILHITHIQSSYYKLSVMCMVFESQQTLNKPTNPSIAGWQYFSSKGDHFNKSIHMSTYVFPISHPVPLMGDDLCWTYYQVARLTHVAKAKTPWHFLGVASTIKEFYFFWKYLHKGMFFLNYL